MMYLRHLDSAATFFHDLPRVHIRPKNKEVFDWRNPTDPIYPADPTYCY